MKQSSQLFLIALLSLFLFNCSGAKSSDTKKSVNDGSSIKNAIKVKSVSEEYEIVRKLCPDCKMNGQALIGEGNKHYDVLKLTNSKGEEVKYYFDINSFYGKW
ncbi:hypothetical protein [Flavobacterium foetidum]|uniref:hypothetical protein n=1 Tax=Flavobacterium foetidum TaxID=2026681 RepID=UPI00107566CE|nr:hypothetical protein [Flavobacterium foetidum]KAF2511224.1 hypothetical protein E0W73_16895 [Flavobacterium foetidum]